MTKQIHIGERVSSKESLCGMRMIEIRRVQDLLIPFEHIFMSYADDTYIKVMDLRKGYAWCSVCGEHPAISMHLLANSDLGGGS